MARRVWSKNGHGETLGSAGNWGLRPRKTNAPVVHRYSRCIPSASFIAYSTSPEAANTESAELYYVLEHRFKAWVQRGQHIRLGTTLPGQINFKLTPESYCSWKPSMHTCISLWLYHWICFRDRPYGGCGANGGCPWKSSSLARTAYRGCVFTFQCRHKRRHKQHVGIVDQ